MVSQFLIRAIRCSKRPALFSGEVRDLSRRRVTELLETFLGMLRW